MPKQTNKVEQILIKLAEFSNLDESQKLEFFKNINQGLLINFLVDGKDIVSPEIFDKLKTLSEEESPSQEEVKLAISAFVKEMSESEVGKKVIQDRLVELIGEMIDSVKDTLSQNQKDELLKILE